MLDWGLRRGEMEDLCRLAGEEDGDGGLLVERLNLGLLRYCRLHEEFVRDYERYWEDAVGLRERELLEERKEEEGVREEVEVLGKFLGVHRPFVGLDGRQKRVVDRIAMDCGVGLLMTMWCVKLYPDPAAWKLYGVCRSLLLLFCRASAREMFVELSSFVFRDLDVITAAVGHELIDCFDLILNDERIKRKLSLYMDRVVTICEHSLVQAVQQQPTTDSVRKTFKSTEKLLDHLPPLNQAPPRAAERNKISDLAMMTYRLAMDQRSLEAEDEWLNCCKSVYQVFSRQQWRLEEEYHWGREENACRWYGDIVLTNHLATMSKFYLSTPDELLHCASPAAEVLLQSSSEPLRVSGAELVHTLLEHLAGRGSTCLTPPKTSANLGNELCKPRRSTLYSFISFSPLALLLGDLASTCTLQNSREYAFTTLRMLLRSVTHGEVEEIDMLREILRQTSNPMVASALIAKVKDPLQSLYKESPLGDSDEEGRVRTSLLFDILPRWLSPRREFFAELDAVLSTANLCLFVAKLETNAPRGGDVVAAASTKRIHLVKKYLREAWQCLHGLAEAAERDEIVNRRILAKEKEEAITEREEQDQNSNRRRKKSKPATTAHVSLAAKVAGKSLTEILLVLNVVEYALSTCDVAMAAMGGIQT